MNFQFLYWHNLKCSLSESKNRPFFQEREIWFAFVGKNIGFEQDGKGEKFLRPVVVLKKFNNETFLAVSLTHSSKTGKFYYPFWVEGQVSTAILSQIKLMDAKRLSYRFGIVDEPTFTTLKTKIRQFLA